MITRLALFISLLALFYYYCKDDSGEIQRQNNDINLIEPPTEMYPGIDREFSPETIINSDTSNHLISERVQYTYPTGNQIIPVAQNY